MIREYSKYKPFRFWCQKVLPLVYDDSLSYYEVLNKVVDYLNNVIKYVNALGTAIESIDAESELPEVTPADANKVLTVNDSGEWVAEGPIYELPVVTTADSGKFLRVNSSGEWSAETVPQAEGVGF